VWGTARGVSYLHAFPETGSIYQPVHIGTRSDIPVNKCTTDQLKFKAEAGAD
jgi:hypothetical protein